MVEVSLTVGKLDASLALLLTKDHHLIEFPTILLPDGVNAGSVVTIKCEQDLDEEKKANKVFEDVQEQILELFGKNEPKAPVLKVKNVTQTSAVLEWDPLDLGSASIKSLTLYKNNSRLGQIPNPLVNTTTKLSGLPIDTPYEFHLRLDTTAGIYQSESVKLKTHKMTDLSGITVCIGEIDPKEGITREDIEKSLANMGAKPLQDEVKVDTTHFICTLGLGPQFKKALDNNIPVVRPEWIKASETERRIIGVRNFYLDADPQYLEPHRFNRSATVSAPAKSETSAEEEEAKPETPEKPIATEETEPETSKEEAPKSEEQEAPKDVLEDVPLDSNEPQPKDEAESSPSDPVTESVGPVSSEPVGEEKVETSNPDELEAKQEDPSEHTSEPIENITATSESVENSKPVDEAPVENAIDTSEVTPNEPVEIPSDVTQPKAEVVEEPQSASIEDESTESKPIESEEPKPETVQTNGDEEEGADDDDEEEEEENGENGEAEAKEQSAPASSNSKKNNKKKNKKKKKKNN